jgi:hypothetical protein
MHALPASVRFRVLALRKDSVARFALSLLRLVFFSAAAAPERFSSIAHVPAEHTLTIIAPATIVAAHFADDSECTLDPTLYAVLGLVHQNAVGVGHNQTGVVASIVAPLSLQHIDHINVSCYATDFVLVGEVCQAAALDALQS